MVLVVDIGLSILFTKLLVHYYINEYDHEILVMAGKTMGASVGGILHYIFMHTWVFSVTSIIYPETLPENDDLNGTVPGHKSDNV